MKQRKFGKKVINWHRSLAPSALRRRFIRGRDNATSIEGGIESLGATGERMRDIWDYDADGYCCEVCYQEWNGYGGEEDVVAYKLSRLLDDIFYDSFWKCDLESIKGLVLEQLGVRTHEIRFHEGPIEERLAAHIRSIESYPRSRSALRASILDSIGDLQALEVLETVGAGIDNPKFAGIVCLFAPFWVASPLDWDQQGGEQALIGHLFACYEVPGFLYPFWLCADEAYFDQFKWLVWFITIGQGGRLKRSAKLFGWNISGKFQQCVCAAPQRLTLEDACLLAEVKRVGGTDWVFETMIRNRFFVWDPTESRQVATREERYRAFWYETVKWLIRFEEILSEMDCDTLLAWSVHEYTEAARENESRFSWKGRTPRAALGRATDYVRELERPWEGKSWEGRDWNWEEGGDSQWSIVELCSGIELFREGQALRHCVGGYANLCESGYAAIFSLRLRGVRCVTIELRRSTGTVVQARGACNRPATSEENAVIARWLRAKAYSS